MYRLLPILLFAYSLAVTTDDIYDNSYALIIGIDKYENVRSLDYAVKDAVDIQSMLVDKFHFQQDNIVLLKDEEATQDSILQEFSNITKKANDNDRVLIFFAGHGETIDLPDGGEMGFLLPVDGDKTDLYLSAIKLEELRTLSLLSERYKSVLSPSTGSKKPISPPSGKSIVSPCPAKNIKTRSLSFAFLVMLENSWRIESCVASSSLSRTILSC
jgi:hypothetical protein